MASAGSQGAQVSGRVRAQDRRDHAQSDLADDPIAHDHGRIQVAVQLVAATPVAGPEPWKPNSTDPLAGTEPFQVVGVTEDPFSWPFQRFVIAVPLGIVSLTVQFEMAADPAVTRTVPTKPPFQELPRVKTAEHDLMPEGGGVVVGG